MAKYAVSEAGVKALNDVALSITEASSQILNLMNTLENVADENSKTLGPHKVALLSTLSQIKESEKEAIEPVKEISEVLNDVANGYLEIIDNDRISASTGETKALFPAGTFETVAGEMGGSVPKYRAVHRNFSPNKIQKHLSEINDFDSLSDYMDSKYGIQLDHSMKSLNLETVKASIRGIESVINEYPYVGEFLKTGITSNLGVMSCNGSELSFNPMFFGSNHALSDKCKEMSATGFWVANSSPESIGAHEAAHGVEWALIQANSGYVNASERRDAWNQCSESGKIVSKACENIMKTPYGKGKSQTELIKSISIYSMKDDSETMAEAFADVYANGANANPLSKEIKRIAKEQIDNYKGVLLC